MKILQEFKLYQPGSGEYRTNKETKELTPQEVEDYTAYTGYFLRNDDGDWYVQSRTLRQENPGVSSYLLTRREFLRHLQKNLMPYGLLQVFVWLSPKKKRYQKTLCFTTTLCV